MLVSSAAKDVDQVALVSSRTVAAMTADRYLSFVSGMREILHELSGGMTVP